MENSMWTIGKMKLKKKNIVNNFHLLTKNQRLPNMLGQRLYTMLGQRFCYMLGQRLHNMLGQRVYNMLGQRFLDEQSADGFASRNQRWLNENCSSRPNVGPTSTCYLGSKAESRKSNNLRKKNESPFLHIPPKRNFRILTVNCRSIKDKTSEFKATLKYAKPDIVI